MEDSIILWLFRNNLAPPPPQSNMVEQGPQNDSSSTQTYLLIGVLWQLLQSPLTGLEGKRQLQHGALTHAPGGKAHRAHNRLLFNGSHLPKFSLLLSSLILLNHLRDSYVMELIFKFISFVNLHNLKSVPLRLRHSKAKNGVHLRCAGEFPVNILLHCLS